MSATATQTVTAWFYIKDDQGFGPVSQEQLCDLFRKGVLGLHTLVHSDAFEEWTPASSIAALRALCAARPIQPVELGEPVPSGRPMLEGPTSDIPFGALDYASENMTDGPIGIGGWLVLPAIGMVFNPLRQALVALGFWAMAQKLSGHGGGSVMMARSLLSFAGLSAGFCAYQVIVAFLFFAKKRSAPTAVIVMFVVNILLNALLAAKMNPTFVNPNAPAGVTIASQIIPSVVVAAVWIPYFCISKRVKRTFVN